MGKNGNCCCRTFSLNFILAFLLALIVIGYNGVDISYVSKVTEGSNAYEAGLREGDRITKYNGATVSVGREILFGRLC